MLKFSAKDVAILVTALVAVGGMVITFEVQLVDLGGKLNAQMLLVAQAQETDEKEDDAHVEHGHPATKEAIVRIDQNYIGIQKDIENMDRNITSILNALEK
jgi:hypothetical protein